MGIFMCNNFWGGFFAHRYRYTGNGGTTEPFSPGEDTVSVKSAP